MRKDLESFLENSQLNKLVERAEEEILSRLKNGSGSFSVAITPGQIPEIEFPQFAQLIRVYGAKVGHKAKVERHPNSFQTLVSIHGRGKTRTFNPNRGFVDGTFNNLYWSFVPENVWHEPVADSNDWVAVTFHSAPESVLIDEYRG